MNEDKMYFIRLHFKDGRTLNHLRNAPLSDFLVANKTAGRLLRTYLKDLSKVEIIEFVEEVVGLIDEEMINRYSEE